jgi:hypothetical protein
MVSIAVIAAGASCRSGGGASATSASSAPPPDVAPAHASAASMTASVAPTASGAPVAAPASGGGAHAWSFDSDADGSAPAGFSFGRTGRGREGKWLVRREGDAPSLPNVLAQVDADATDYRFPVAWANDPVLADLELSVRCKPVSGEIDRACGVVFRLRDANNYYLSRANALENNVRLYFVKRGERRQIASWSGRVSSGVWHEYRMRVQGDHIEVTWDGTKVIDHHDATFSDAGRVGLWTKADSVTYFDDLAVKPL